MIILSKKNIRAMKLSQNQFHFVLVIGEGLIGSALRDHLISIHNYEINFNLKLHWGSSEFLTDLETLKTYLKKEIFDNDQLNKFEPLQTQISIVWCAGKGGFSASQKDLELEKIDFVHTLNSLRELSLIKPKYLKFEFEFDLHFTSSAGGLFEGQSTAIHENLEPIPARPYGFFKLNQEYLLREFIEKNSSFRCNVYRLSTVYGRIRKGQRMGLISNMLQNGVKKSITLITGDLFTLRDYIHTSDVAKIISAGMFSIQKNTTTNHDNQFKIIFALSNKPTSIFEIKSIIEFYLKHKIYIQLHYNPDNSKDITFRKLNPPFGIQTLDIRSGIKDVLVHWYGEHS